MCVGATNEITLLEMAYILSLHNASVMLIHAGWPPHKDPGNKTPTQSILGFIAWILWANCMSQGRIVTHFLWMAHRLVSSNKPTRYTSTASFRAAMVIPWNHMFDLKSWEISQANLWKGSLQMRSLEIFCYLKISLSVMVPGLNWYSCEAALVLGACLPLCEGDFCPWMAFLGPGDPFHFAFFCSGSLHQGFPSLPLGLLSLLGLGQKSAWGFFSLNFAWAS